MKTITPKDALKLFLFLLILSSAKAISSPKLPDDVTSSGSGSRLGCVNKTTATATAKTYAAVPKGNAVKDNKRFKK